MLTEGDAALDSSRYRQQRPGAHTLTREATAIALLTGAANEVNQRRYRRAGYRRSAPERLLLPPVEGAIEFVKRRR